LRPLATGAGRRRPGAIQRLKDACNVKKQERLAKHERISFELRKFVPMEPPLRSHIVMAQVLGFCQLIKFSFLDNVETC
jgi:hypothetical protein